MNDFRSRTAPDKARKLITQLQGLKVKPPREALDLVARLGDLESRRPPVITTQDVAAMYAEGRYEDAELATLTMVATTSRQEAYTAGRILLGRQILWALTSNGNTITLSLRKLAEPLIDTLTAAATLTNQSVADLVREGRNDDAATLAKVDYTAGELDALYGLRDSICAGADFGQEHGQDCRRWRDPRKIREARATMGPREPTSTEYYLTGIRANAGLWFPTADEANAIARPIAAAEKKRAEDNRPRGAGIASFTR